MSPNDNPASAADYQVSDELALWWLSDPAQPRLIGTLRHFRRQARQPGGVSLSYSPQWLASGVPLSEDLPLRAGEFLPAETDAAAGAVDDSRPDRWGERIIRFDRASGKRRHALSAHVALRAAGQPYGYPELALLLRRRGPSDLIAAQGEQLFRRMVFNVLIDNTDDHEKNHALIADAAQLYQLSPAFDVLPTGQALGYQQMRLGRDGAESSWSNMASEPRAFAIDAARAKFVGAEVARIVQTWRDHFKAAGVIESELDMLSQQIDRPFLLEQRKQALGRGG